MALAEYMSGKMIAFEIPSMLVDVFDSFKFLFHELDRISLTKPKLVLLDLHIRFRNILLQFNVFSELIKGTSSPIHCWGLQALV